MTTRDLTRRSPLAPFFGERDPFITPFFGRFFNWDPFRADALAPTEDLSSRTWMPPVDVRETDDAFLISAELPGLSKEDIQITFENGVLRLSGERRLEKEEGKENYHRIERAYGSFSRSFTLGNGVDPSKVSAGFKDGVLTITVPKAAEAKPRQISIS
jgi:HSP20 family protein